MFTWGSKYFLGLSAMAFVAAVAYAIISGGGLLGGLSFGWYHGVGDHVGFAVLMGLAVALFGLGVVAVWVRDAEAEDMAVLAGTERVPQAVPPAHPSYWGAVLAFAVGSLLIGATVSTVFLYLGAALLAVVALEWLVLAWTDRATGDPAANQTLRNRLMMPVEVPLFGAVAIAMFAIGVSRVLLAVSAIGAVVVASVVAVIVFGLAIAFVYRSGWFSRNLVSGLVAGVAALVLVGGVVGAAVGPRDFEHHEPGHSEGSGEEDHGEGSETEGDADADAGEEDDGEADVVEEES